jgi:hypothetical protein
MAAAGIFAWSLSFRTPIAPERALETCNFGLSLAGFSTLPELAKVLVIVTRERISILRFGVRNRANDMLCR